MSLVFMDGFDGGDTLLAGKWTTAAGTSAVNATDPIHGSSLAMGSGVSRTKLLLPAQEDDLLIIGGHHRSSAGLLGSLFALLADGATTTHITLTVAADGSLSVRRGTGGGTILGTTATGLIATNTWYHLALKVLLHDTTGTVDLEVDGNNVLSLTGQDTKNAGTDAVFDAIQLLGAGSGGSHVHRYDDIYVCNGVDSGVAGRPNNDFLGVCRVDNLLPTADSTPEQWALSTGTSSFELIDEATPNDDTDYITSDVSGEITQVAMADLTDTTHTVFGLQTSAYAKKSDSGDAQFRVGLDSDISLVTGADHSLAEAYATYLDIFETDPDGSVAWTPAQVNAVEAYVEVRP